MDSNLCPLQWISHEHILSTLMCFIHIYSEFVLIILIKLLEPLGLKEMLHLEKTQMNNAIIPSIP